MFRITIMVHDKHLADALRKLVGLSIGPPEVVPVVNAVERNKKVVAAVPNGGYAHMLVEHMRKHGMKEITGKQAKTIITDVGGRPSSYSYFLQEAVKEKWLKKAGRVAGGNTMRYVLVPQ